MLTPQQARDFVGRAAFAALAALLGLGAVWTAAWYVFAFCAPDGTALDVVGTGVFLAIGVALLYAAAGRRRVGRG